MKFKVGDMVRLKRQIFAPVDGRDITNTVSLHPYQGKVLGVQSVGPAQPGYDGLLRVGLPDGSNALAWGFWFDRVGPYTPFEASLHAYLDQELGGG